MTLGPAPEKAKLTKVWLEPQIAARPRPVTAKMALGAGPFETTGERHEAQV